MLYFQLIDANDNEPTFSQLIYAFDIPEDALQGYRVGQVQAKDPDKGVNGEITYSVLSDWGNDVFSVNPQTGIFTLIGRLDYEEVNFFNSFLGFMLTFPIIILFKFLPLLLQSIFLDKESNQR